MLYKIKNKKVKIILKDETIELPSELKEQINENFEKMKKVFRFH